MGHAFRLVVIVVVCCRHGATGTLVLADGPVLEVVVAPVYQADLIIATIAVESAHVRAARARIVVAVVLENIVLALVRPSVDSKVEVTSSADGTRKFDISGSCLGPALP